MNEKALVVGVSPGNIGEMFAHRAEHLMHDEIFAPTLNELDVAVDESIEDYVTRFGPFDKIIYTAGINNLAWTKDLTRKILEKHYDVNVFGPALLIAAHERVWPNHEGRIVVVVSDASDTPMRGSLAYCSSKAAQEMVVRCLARELAPRWITVAVSPGVVEDTPMTESIDGQVQELRGWTPEEARAYEDKGSILGRRVTKDEVVETIAFAMLGPEVLNGTTIQINGGK